MAGTFFDGYCYGLVFKGKEVLIKKASMCSSKEIDVLSYMTNIIIHWKKRRVETMRFFTCVKKHYSYVMSIVFGIRTDILAKRMM